MDLYRSPGPNTMTGRKKRKEGDERDDKQGGGRVVRRAGECAGEPGAANVPGDDHRGRWAWVGPVRDGLVPESRASPARRDAGAGRGDGRRGPGDGRGA